MRRLSSGADLASIHPERAAAQANPGEPAPPPVTSRHHGPMAPVMVSVQADSEAEALAWLDRLRTLGLVPVGRLMPITGRDRWMVRAEPQRGQRHDGCECTQPHDAS
jgi:hypothetical protein